jgi:hypothetical protein
MRKETAMELFKKIPITIEGKVYEIRIYYDDTLINVVAFHNNRPVNGFRYHVQLPKKCNAKSVLEHHDFNELVQKAKDDISENRWDTLSNIIQQNTVQ